MIAIRHACHPVPSLAAQESVALVAPAHDLRVFGLILRPDPGEEIIVQTQSRGRRHCDTMARSRPSLPARYQQTRFQRRVAEFSVPLTAWAGNPWRRFSLLSIVLLLGFAVGGGVGSITGALSHLDPVSALLCVMAIEAASRCRGRLMDRPGDRLGLQLLDMARMGLLYGLLLDGFKLL